MANKMLIDACHPEETRVVVVRGQKVEEFDFESASRRQLRGNIYLAKVTRVEPSLQAAFVEYGGNRHGFLAFSEIHPDYYQIPVADRQALLEEDARAERDEEREDERRRSRRPRHASKRRAEGSEESVSAEAEEAADDRDEPAGEPELAGAEAETGAGETGTVWPEAEPGTGETGTERSAAEAAEPAREAGDDRRDEAAPEPQSQSDASSQT